MPLELNSIMKIHFTLALACSMLLSCTSVNKLMEEGNYTQAFQTSLSKLKGEKNKKTDHVKALEKSFAKLQEQTDREVIKLNTDERPENWPLVLEQYLAMEKRQQQVDPLLPLVSETRYKAEFQLRDYTQMILQAEEKTCEYYYNRSKELVRRTEETGNREFARQAYNELALIEKYRKSYKDFEKVRDKAKLAGTTLIFLEVESDMIGIHGRGIEKELLTLPVSRLDDFWTDYTVDSRDKQEADFEVRVELEDILFSPERESINRFVESKEILVQKDQKQTKKDTVVVVTEKEIYEKVNAEIIEVFREKKSELTGRLIVTNPWNKEVIHSFPVSSVSQFTGYCCRVEGDERALTENTKKKLDPYCELFPTDFTMAEALAQTFKKTVLAELEKINLR